MKKLLFSALAVLLAAAMSVTFFACKKNDEPETDASGNTIVKIMVHVAEQSAEGKAYKQVTDSFNVSETAKSNKIKVRVEYKPRSNSATGYETELINMMNNGNLPDIITFDAPNTWSYADAGILKDITELISEDTQSDFLK